MTNEISRALVELSDEELDDAAGGRISSGSPGLRSRMRDSLKREGGLSRHVASLRRLSDSIAAQSSAPDRG